VISEQDVKESARNEVETLKFDLEEVKTHFNQARSSVDEDIAAILATKIRFDDIEKNLTETSAAILVAQKGIQDTKNDFVTARNEAKAELDALLAQLKKLQPEIDAIHKHHEAITKIHENLMEDTKDQEGNVTAECPVSAIQSLQKKISDEFDGIKSDRKMSANQLEELKVALEAEIRSLLPGAGAARLAHAYFDAKARYGSTPFRPNAKANDLFNVLTSVQHSLKNLSFLFYYALFIAPLIVIYWTFKDIVIQDLTLGILLFRVLISTPMAIVSWFGFSSIRLNRRLYEEYNHKQRVMELFYSFEGIIAKDGKEDQKQKLLEIMLKVVDHRPSLIMANYDKGADGIFSRFFGTRSSGVALNES
jgi:hypothetical protein